MRFRSKQALDQFVYVTIEAINTERALDLEKTVRERIEEYKNPEMETC